MMLLILDKNPITAGLLVPDKIRFKQLLELCQMICSCGYSDVYKKIKQGQNIQEWIKNNYTWVRRYAETLLHWCEKNVNLKPKTREDFNKIINSMPHTYFVLPIRDAILRYKEGYECEYPTNTELPIEECIREYEKYIMWKGWE